MSTLTRRGFLAGLGAVGALGAAGCGLGTGGGFTRSGSLAGPVADIDLSGVSIAVGSKNFTEQILLGKIAVVLLASAGADVQDLTNIPGSASARQAMLQDETQMQWEYTGTAWIAYLGESDPIPTERGQYEAVRDRDLEDNHLVWLDPAPMNNTYGFAAPRATAERLGITTMSQLKELPTEQRSFCVESEFNNRNDGLDPLLKTYGLARGSSVPSDQIRVLDTGAIYDATASGLCTFGEVFTTDGRIKALDLVVLDDDKAFFPKYNVSAVFTEAIITAHPQLRDLFAPVSAALTDDLLIDLNAQVDVEGGEPGEVAWQWLSRAGFVTE